VSAFLVLDAAAAAVGVWASAALALLDGVFELRQCVLEARILGRTTKVRLEAERDRLIEHGCSGLPWSGRRRWHARLLAKEAGDLLAAALLAEQEVLLLGAAVGRLHVVAVRTLQDLLPTGQQGASIRIRPLAQRPLQEDGAKLVVNKALKGRKEYLRRAARALWRERLVLWGASIEDGAHVVGAALLAELVADRAPAANSRVVLGELVIARGAAGGRWTRPGRRTAHEGIGVHVCVATAAATAVAAAATGLASSALERCPRAEREIGRVSRSCTKMRLARAPVDASAFSTPRG